MAWCAASFVRRAIAALAACGALGVCSAAAAAATPELPASLVGSLSDAAALTSVVVTDIDRDGDADVVATDEALNLFVWINDGTGHLTRQRPAPARNGAAESERKGVEPGSPASPPYAPTDPPAFGAEVYRATAAPLVVGRVARLASDRRRDCPRFARRLRGPPDGSPLR